MPYIDNFIFDKKSVKKNLTLVLDEGDDIISCIKDGMAQHGVDKVSVDSVDGMVNEALINYFERNSFKSSVIRDKSILIASGAFKLSFGELFGQMKIVTNDKPPMHGTLVRGRAKGNFTLRLAFHELVENKRD